MKKFIKYILVIGIMFSFILNVDAQNYQKGEIIPVNTLASVDTDLFMYRDFIYNPLVDDKGNGSIVFNSITNKSKKKAPVSVNILLFDNEQKNIGFLTYCTEKDVDSNYAQFNLNSNQTASFSINVTKRYFVEGKSSMDVKYISLLDENKYCQIGGYDKYKGLTIEEITGGKVASQFTEEGKLKELMIFFKDKSLMIMIFVIGFFIASIIITGVILNALYKRMYAKTTVMAYIPGLNNFISVKLAFGDLIGKVFLGFYGIALLFLMKISFLSVIVSFISFISFIVVIVKLVTKKYDLFIYNPSIKNNISNNKSNNNLINSSVNDNNNSKESNFFDSDMSNSFIEAASEDVVDISYNNVSAGANNDFDTPNSMTNNLVNQDNNTKEDDEGESDLSQFFK